MINEKRNKVCNDCGEEKDISLFGKVKTCRDGHRGYCKACHKARKDRWRNENREWHNSKCREWSFLNKDKNKTIKKKSLEKALLINPMCIIESKRKWRKKYPEKSQASVSARRKRAKQSTPKWVNLFFIEEAYLLAKLRTTATGFKWHVDHIIPLRGKTVCGLHVIENLAVIPAILNQRKGNKFI